MCHQTHQINQIYQIHHDIYHEIFNDHESFQEAKFFFQA